MTNQNFNPKTPPLKHQIEAIKYLSEKPNTALFDEQGLGKTKIVIDALSLSMKNEQIQGALIVTPLSLVYIWEKEISKHSHLIPIILRGTKQEKRYKYLTGANFYITNYEAVTNELDRLKRFCKSHRIAIVLDEAVRIKDPKSKTAKALFDLSPIAEKRIIVTGTPVANKPFDIWSLYFFLDQGNLLGQNFESFKSEYDEKKPDYLLKLKHLRDILSSNSIRRLKSDVLHLPEKIFKNIYVNLHGAQLQIYNDLKEELHIDIVKLDGLQFYDEADNILKKLLRLTQIASNPWLLDKRYNEIPPKFTAAFGLIENIISRREKAIIWTTFIENIYVLKNHLKKYNPLIIHGEIDAKERSICIDKFQNNDQYKILIANPAAAKEGLTLTRANNAIYIDRNFNLIDYLQSQDRIHRISQDRKCIIYKIIAKDTIDEYIDSIVDLKTNIAHFIEGDIDSLSKRSRQTLLNKQELLQILGGKYGKSDHYY